MKIIGLIVMLFFFTIGCDNNGTFRIAEIKALKVNTQFDIKWLHKDIQWELHKQSLDNTVYKIWYHDGSVASGYYYITVRNADSLLTSIWCP